MTSPTQEPTEIKVAKLGLQQAQAKAKAIKLASLFITLGLIFTAALVSHQDPAMIQGLGGSLFAIAIAGWILM